MGIRSFLLGCIVVGYCHELWAQAPTPITQPTLSAQLPSEVVDGSGAPLLPNAAVTEPPFAFFDDFAWRSFIALMWPAKVGERGQPDRSPTKSYKDVDGPRVWETWKSAYETIPRAGVTPKPWESFDGVTPCESIPEAGSGKKRVIATFHKFGSVSQAQFGRDLAGPLVAQNDTFVHYEIKVNQAEFNFIREKHLYDLAEIEKLTRPGAPTTAFPFGSVEVKAAWREFRDEPERVRKRYYRTRVMIKNYRTNTCAEKELGLIAFHIVHKTPKRPQWVWASFEHTDNVPTFGQAPPLNAVFTLNNSDKRQVLDPDETHVPTTITDATYLKADNVTPVQPPMQVVRLRPIESRTTTTNSRYQDALFGTVWANYFLVLTQWPSAPAIPNGAPFPELDNQTCIANTALETYFQNQVSCMSCHDTSRDQQNLDFVFFPVVHAFNHGDASQAPTTGAFIRKLQSDFNKARGESQERSNRRMGNK
jgi:hypothetical protein